MSLGEGWSAGGGAVERMERMEEEVERMEEAEEALLSEVDSAGGV